MKRQLIWVICLMVSWAGIGFGGEEVMVNGVLHVRNSEDPEQGRETLEIEELWRVGSDEDDLFFGLIVQVQEDKAGNLLLLDEVRSHVFVLIPEGELLKTLGHEGEGPGEVRDPNDLLIFPDGRVGLASAMPGKLVTLDRNGNPAGDIHLNRGGPNQNGKTTLTSA